MTRQLKVFFIRIEEHLHRDFLYIAVEQEDQPIKKEKERHTHRQKENKRDFYG